MDQTEFKPFAVLSQARPCRIAFLIDPANCPPELIDALFATNYGLWGGRFNPIIPVSNGVIPQPFWLLLRYADPDVVYTYTKLSLETIRKIEHEVGPLRIESHPEWMLQRADPFFAPNFRNRMVPSHRLISIVLSSRSWSVQKPKLLTSKASWNWPHKRSVMRNFGLFEETVFSRAPDGTERLEINNDWSYSDLFDHIAKAGPIVFPFQLSEAMSGFGRPEIIREPAYSIIVGDHVEDWIHFWNRIFLLSNPQGSQWNSLCVPRDLLADQNFGGSLREFLRRFAYRSGNSPPELKFKSFELSVTELRELGSSVTNGIDASATFEILKQNEFPSLAISKPAIFPTGVPGPAGQQRFGSTQQQAVTRSSLLQSPASLITLDDATWVMDLQVEYVPRFSFYANETLWWQLPRRLPVAQAFVPQTASRIDRTYAISVEMKHYGPFELRVPSDNEMLHRALGVQTTTRYTADLKIEHVGPKFKWAVASDKTLYTNGIITLFGGLQSAGRMLHSLFWRTVFEQLAKRGGESEQKLFESVRNSLAKKRQLIAEQLSGGHEKPIEWLTNLVIKLARQAIATDAEISFPELKKNFLDQRELFIANNPTFRTTQNIAEIQKDQEEATQDLRGVLQSLTDATILLQGISARCSNCGSRFWRELGALESKWQCRGCNATVFAPVEPVWRYRLNTLVRNGIAFHGCLAVISALYELRKSCRNTFIYSPGMAFYSDYDSESPEAEVDLVCICDGDLVCGEVKSDSSEFSEEELAKLARIAGDLGADRVVISAFYDKHKLMENSLNKLKKLLPNGCEVQAYSPALAFEFSPHAAF